jgi:hypothetical protein
MQINVLRELRQPIGTVTVDFEEPSARSTEHTCSTSRIGVNATNGRRLLVTLTAEPRTHLLFALSQGDQVPIEITFEENTCVIDASTGAPIPSRTRIRSASPPISS